MSEKRKPIIKFLLQIQGKGSNKIEIFPAKSWYGIQIYWPSLNSYENWENRYRVRLNGKWFSPKSQYTFFTKTQIKNIMFKSLNFKDI